jgi:hypothetical protein
VAQAAWLASRFEPAPQSKRGDWLSSKGGHGFGMRKQNLPSDLWIERFGEWLGVQGLLKR